MLSEQLNLNLWAQVPVSWRLFAAVRVCLWAGAGRWLAQTGKTGLKQRLYYVPVTPQLPGRLAFSPVTSHIPDAFKYFIILLQVTPGC